MRTVFIIVTLVILTTCYLVWPKTAKRAVADYENRLLCRVACKSALQEARTIFRVSFARYKPKADSFFAGLLPPYSKQAQREYSLPVDNSTSLFASKGVTLVGGVVTVKRHDACNYEGRGQGLLEFLVKVKGPGKSLALTETVRFLVVQPRRKNEQQGPQLRLRKGLLATNLKWHHEERFGATAIDGFVALEKSMQDDIARIFVDRGVPTSPRVPHKRINYNADKSLQLTVAIPVDSGAIRTANIKYSVAKTPLPSGQSVLSIYRKESASPKRLLQGVLVKDIDYIKLATRRRAQRADYLSVRLQSIGVSGRGKFSTQVFIALRSCPWVDYLKPYTLE